MTAERSAIVATFCALLLAILLPACVPAGLSRGTLRSVTPIAVDSGQAAALISAFRRANGLGPVRVDPTLTRVAVAQARANGGGDRMNHNQGGSLSARVLRAGYDFGAAAENLGAGYPSLAAAVEGWERSPGHRRNLLNPAVTEIGIAAVGTPPGSHYRTYWALVLAAPRPQPSAGAAGPFAMFAPR